MTAQLQNLDGSPLTWAEAHRRVTAYWATHELDGEPKRPPVVYSYGCARDRHRICKQDSCTCWCHKEAGVTLEVMDAVESQWVAALTNADRALGEAIEAGDIERIVMIRDQAAALERLAQQQRYHETWQRQISGLKLRSERAAGSLLANLDREQGRRTDLEEPERTLHPSTPWQRAIKQAQISEDAAKRWQKESEVSESGFIEYLATDLEPTSAGLRAWAKKLQAGGAHVGRATGEFEWYTPREYIDAARRVMGAIDLDPASSEAANRIIQAETFYATDDDGLTKDWAGRVWMNPPYAQPAIQQFCERLKVFYEAGYVTEAVVLTNNATETAWFGSLSSCAVALCHPQGRIKFWNPEKETATPLQGQAITYFGPNADVFKAEFSKFGRVWS